MVKVSTQPPIDTHYHEDSQDALQCTAIEDDMGVYLLGFGIITVQNMFTGLYPNSRYTVFDFKGLPCHLEP